MEKLQLIDFSLEDDFLVPHFLEDFQLSVAMENKDEHKSFKQFVNAKKATEMFDKREERRSNGSERATNSRDSLAWDSAFFTNAGVLDPDELFTMNKGFEKPEVRKRKSTYSDYMFDTDGFLLESYRNDEFDLFEDVRASIRKSKTKTNMHSEGYKQKAHTGPNLVDQFKGESFSGDWREKTRSFKQDIPISKKLDYMPQNRVKFIPNARKQRVYSQGSGKNEKSTASPFISQPHEKNGKTKPFSPRPPKISGRVNLSSTGLTRNVPVNVDSAKIQHKSTTSSSGTGLFSSKTSRLGKSSSSLSLTASSDSISYCSPFSSVSSMRSSSKSKIKPDIRISTLSSSVSNFKTPLKCSFHVENELENPNSSTISNRSSYYSAASTIDECSFDSSPVLYMNSRDRNDDTSAELARRFKPSGLKPPSPKIGFFDKEHSSADYQFHIGSQSASSHINGVTAKRKPRDSTLIIAQARRLSPSSSATGSCTEQKPVTNNKSPKPRLKLKKVDGAQFEKQQRNIRSSCSIERKRIKADLENRIEKEMKRHIRLSTIVPRLSKNKPEKENLTGLEDNVESLSRYFEGINLKSESQPRARMPLADNNCVRNGFNSK